MTCIWRNETAGGEIPVDESTFKQKLNDLIAGYTKGKDEGKLRIIVK